ncbi:MAG: endonuclease/exonuclease/phosphatase family protein, partial [Pseudomonadota bacterium]|nr:endonuclease/exonuclease/phosphatase family protein [Pseudomonadota bacterium]
MLKPLKSIKLLKHQNSISKERFNVLCWNVAKLSQKKDFKDYLHSIVEEEEIDFLLLQEVKEGMRKDISLNDYSYVLSPNIVTKNHIFGVMNAFKVSCQSAEALLTQTQELKYMTHKSSLITRHLMVDQQNLLVVNLHAVNFVTSRYFQAELNYIKSQISSHEGSLIVAGDFNAWNFRRVAMLREFARELLLTEVTFDCDKHIKKVFSKRLDYVFYRALSV